MSPITPWTGLVGLLFILVVSAAREGWEDFVRASLLAGPAVLLLNHQAQLRHRADRKVNDREYRLLKEDGQLKNAKRYARDDNASTT